MRFVFSERKAAQAAAQLLLMHKGHSMELYRLLKLLYLADRKSLVDTGHTITGDKMVSMRAGPLPSNIYDAIKDSATPGSSPRVWSDYVGRGKGHLVFLNVDKPEADELSPYEIGVLAEIHSKHGDYGFSEFRDFTHEFPEWHDPGNSSSPIDPGEILRSAGIDEEQIEEIAALAEEECRLAEILGKPA